MTPGGSTSNPSSCPKTHLSSCSGSVHRYLCSSVLHTDEPHPHVHLIVKAVSEQGVRLNIRKAILREWRSRFAHHLRQEGIAANATDRFTRGEIKSPKLDGIYRPMHDPKRYSTHMHGKLESIAAELLRGNFGLNQVGLP